MAILKVTSEEVRVKASEIEAQKNLMESLMNEMQSKADVLLEYWQSSSGIKFRENYTHVIINICNSLDTLITHVRNLNEAAQTYETLEGDQLKGSESLSTNKIFDI